MSNWQNLVDWQDIGHVEADFKPSLCPTEQGKKKVVAKTEDGQEILLGYIAHDGGLTGDAPSAKEILDELAAQKKGIVTPKYSDGGEMSYTFITDPYITKPLYGAPCPMPPSYQEMMAKMVKEFAAASHVPDYLVLPDGKISHVGSSTPSGPSNARLVDEMQKRIPGMSQGTVCPACWKLGISNPATVRQTVIHLNDHHHWTREQIADWLDTLDIDLTVHDADEIPEVHATYGVIEWTSFPMSYATMRSKARLIVAIPGADYNLMVDISGDDPWWVPEALDGQLCSLQGQLQAQTILALPGPIVEEEFLPTHSLTVHKVPYTPCKQPLGTVHEVLTRGGFSS